MKNELINKGLVSLVIETALIEVGKPVYDRVLHDLYAKYHCYLPDCYEHPNYLSDILHNLYGDAHKIIVESIRKQLQEFSYKQDIEKFLQVISP